MEITCSICCETTEPATDEFCAPSCGHVFHVECLRGWIERSPTCPQCRCLILGRIGRIYLNWTRKEDSLMENVIRDHQNELDRLQAELREKDQIVADLEERCANSSVDLQSVRRALERMDNGYSELRDKYRKTEADLDKERQKLEISEITAIENNKKIAEMERALERMDNGYSELRDKYRKTEADLDKERQKLEISEITVIENNKKIAEMERELAAKNKRCAEMELSTADLTNLFLEERRKNRDLAESLSKLRGLNEAGKSENNSTENKNPIKTIKPKSKARLPRAPLTEVQNTEEPHKSHYNLRRRL